MKQHASRTVECGPPSLLPWPGGGAGRSPMLTRGAAMAGFPHEPNRPPWGERDGGDRAQPRPTHPASGRSRHPLTSGTGAPEDAMSWFGKEAAFSVTSGEIHCWCRS